jgi:hypothetical protein
MRIGLLAISALLVLPALATVTPYSWIRSGESGSVFTDSSGAGHPFNAAFSSGPPPAAGGNPAIVFSSSVTAGGPLGPAAVTSTVSTRWGFYNFGNSGMWVQGQGGNGSVPGCDLFCLPPTNWVMECWVLPVHDGHSGGGFADDGTGAQFMSTGSGQFGGQPGGVAFRTRYDAASDTVAISCWSIGPLATNNFQIGDAVISDKTKFIHVAAVNDNGTLTFYTNGVSAGSTNVNLTSPSPSTPYIGSGQDTGAPFDGYLDECRYSTFAPGAFVVSDLLLRPPGPGIVSNPQSTTVWAGGTAPFRITTAYDTSTLYQWRRTGNISGATSNQYILPTAVVGDSGATFDCVVTASSISKTSTVATLTVITNDPAEVAAYRSLINGEASLVGYFPADNNTGTTLVNTKDATHNGTLEMDAYFDGRTNQAFGQRAISFLGNGDVQIPNNPAFEFPSGNGTIEFILYLDPDAGNPPTDQTIFSQATDGSMGNDGSTVNYYWIRATQLGGSIKYGNDAGANLSWVVPGGMVGKRTHIAIVFSNTTNVTAYANGLNLGTLVQTNFGSATGASSWIGSMGTASSRYWLYGSVDELSIYSAALAQSTIQVHYSGYFFGTHTAPASFVSQSPSKSLLAGASPVLRGTATGTLPISYQWQKNGIDIPSETRGTLELSNVTTTATYTLVATNNYGSPATSGPIVLTIVAPPSGYATRVMQDAPRAYWRLSESSGTTAIDSAGFNDGTYEGTYTLGYPPFQGETGSAVLFNGSSGRAIVPNSPDINPNGPFSIELWAKFVGGNGGNQVALSSLDRPSRGAGYEYYHGGNYNGWEFHTGGGGNYDALVGDNQKEPVGVWWHVIGTYNGSEIRLYVNGQPANQDTVAATDPPFTPNTVKNLFIGSRSDNGNFFNGAIADVAFYNYVLSPARISNHWSSVWTAAAITQNPGATNTTELSTITLSATASGLPNGYQWYKDNVALVGTATNFDGTAHYPGGVTSPTLTIAKVTTADAGQYHMVVINPVAGAQTTDAAVGVTADTTPPNVVSAGSMDGATVDICFDEFLDPGGFDPGADPGTARNAANYTFTSPGGVTVTSVELRKNGKAVRLFVTGLPSAAGTAFTVKVANVRDWSRRVANAIPVAGQTVSGKVQGFFTTVVDVLANPAFLSGTTYSCAPGEFEAESGGGDIWDANDNFHYTYREVTGDFDVRVQVAAETLTLPGNRNGIMLRETTDPQSRFAYVTWNPGNIVGYHVRETLATTPIWANPPFNNWASLGPPPNVWLRLQRKAGVTAAFVSVDGFLWSPFGTTSQVFADPALLGLATCNGGNTTTPGFTQYANYGNVSQLQLINVGGTWTLSWTGPGVLQSSTVSVSGPYTTAASQANPQTVTPGSGLKFFRLLQ